jgi:hypothetical protein
MSSRSGLALGGHDAVALFSVTLALLLTFA